jgi:peptidoglycan/LPS O-acetylase OafA/YrhL
VNWTTEINAGPPKPSLLRRVQGLDELRGLSIIWVFICHGTGLTTWMPKAFAGYGYHGVVLFFMISGYLITRILLESRDHEHYFSRFYINRVFRIWPLMLLALLLSALVWPEYARSGVLNLLLVNNYGMAVGVVPPMRTDVMWSLAIEEQFYLFWPVLLWLLAGRQVLAVIGVIILLGLAFDAQLLPGGHMIIHKATHGTMQYIAMGAAVAFGMGGLRIVLAAWGVFLAWWMLKNGLSDWRDFRWIWYGVTFALGLLVFYTVHGRSILKNRPLATIGKLCYGLYIIHFFVSVLALYLFGKSVWQAPLAYVVLSLLLAVLSYHYFELPIQNRRVAFYDNKKFQIGLFAGFAFMGLICVVYLVTISRPAGFVFE